MNPAAAFLVRAGTAATAEGLREALVDGDISDVALLRSALQAGVRAADQPSPADVDEGRGVVDVLTIDGREAIGSRYAAKRYPGELLPPEAREIAPDGVPFKPNGCPDFSEWAEHEVQIEVTGNYYEDFRAANQAAGLGNSGRSPEGFTWHHVEDGTTMQLLPTELHSSVPHTGGRAVAAARGAGREVKMGATE